MINKKKADEVRRDIENYLDGLSGSEKFSGSVLVSIEGEKVISKGYGMANYELEVPNTPETKFRIGSITKQFTAAAILQLCEKGIINLKDTLDKYIPDYPDGNKVTIHHLLTHSSGIFDHTNTEDFESKVRKRYSVIDLVDEIKQLPYIFEPGTKFTYSNSGYVLLGYIIEKATEESYGQYIDKNIFKRLSMNNSGYDDYKKIIKGRANGYDFQGEEKLLVNCDFLDMSIPYSAGALYSTVEDLYIWDSKLTKGEIISKNSANQMLSKEIKTKNFYYGYGFYLKEAEFGGKIRKKLWHRGGVNGFLGCNVLFPDEDIKIIILSNIFDVSLDSKISRIESIIFEDISFES